MDFFTISINLIIFQGHIQTLVDESSLSLQTLAAPTKVPIPMSVAMPFAPLFLIVSSDLACIGGVFALPLLIFGFVDLRQSHLVLGESFFFWVCFFLLVYGVNPLVLTVRRDLWDPGRQKLVVVSPYFESCAQGCQFQGFKVWDIGDFWVLGFGGTSALEVQIGNLNMFRMLPKLNPKFLCLLDLGQFKFLFKNKHDQICKFRLWL